ncbi:DNA repair protein rhp26 [Dispira parvispora]|uniref:DNA repair protein rhp26 n=1 Tax=Dispira parvispora TaxID=1520584 RepID=A0A9W8B024_9FUNG|nr:DNA repair protein rhp26 [Dispira parvispora]
MAGSPQNTSTGDSPVREQLPLDNESSIPPTTTTTMNTNVNPSPSESLSELLGVQAIVDQTTLEASVMSQANEQLRQQELANESKRLDRTKKREEKLTRQLQTVLDKLDRSRNEAQRLNCEVQIKKLQEELTQLAADQRDIQQRYTALAQETTERSGALPSESERERLIRLGKLNPFAETTASFDTSPVVSPASVQGVASSPVDVDDESAYVGSTSEESGAESEPEMVGSVYHDDGDELAYQRRLHRWIRKRQKMRKRAQGPSDKDSIPNPEEEPFLPHPTLSSTVISKRVRVPGELASHLFDYQVTCLRWLWELHNQKVGGILGDEMGLGKTVQIAAFLGSLYHSRVLERRVEPQAAGQSTTVPVPTLIVCPATIMKQWVKEFHRWWPPLRVMVLHSTGSGWGLVGDNTDSKRKRTNYSDEELDDLDNLEEQFELASASHSKRSRASATRRQGTRSGSQPWVEHLLTKAFERGHIVVTTYAGMRTHASSILKRKWAYVVLDEGHKIRNPDAEITLVCKRLKTCHRIILSGTPIQNNLTELWSLFDFVFPGRLGTLPVFQEQFAAPISLGGFANANNYQVQTAYQCACILRDLITPYLLRRLKVDVARDLPQKQEQVLFCNLTEEQRNAYQAFLNSGEMTSILEGRRQVLFGIDIVRKICNHPDLLFTSYVKQLPLYREGPSSSRKRKSKADQRGRHRDYYGNISDDDSNADGTEIDLSLVSDGPNRPKARGKTSSTEATKGSAESLSFVVPSGTKTKAPLPSSRPPNKPTTGSTPTVSLRSPGDPDFGNYRFSGKMVVVKHLLELWKQQGHRVLLFSQTRQVLDLLENMVQNLNIPSGNDGTTDGDVESCKYQRMDGTTPIQRRATLIDTFNQDPSIFIFLLTTKVGGLGTNLTGADRVIIFDPDWNPSTDTQARERAWRLGQNRPVTIYRLMTAGTIEEKIYHRQIYKQFLTSKILKDPKQKRFFKSHDMRDLFTLGDGEVEGTETGNMFEGTETTYPPAKGNNEDGDGYDTPRSTRRRNSLQASKRSETGRIQTSQQVAKIETWQPPNSGSARPTSKDESRDIQQVDNQRPKAAGDDDVLSQLFEMSGLKTAVQHDAIIDSHHQEEVLVEREATRIANDAAKALRESRKARQQISVSVPTWTGSSGSAGAPRFGARRTPLPLSTHQEGGPTRQLGISPGPVSQGPVTGVNLGSPRPSGALASGDLLANLRARQLTPTPTKQPVRTTTQFVRLGKDRWDGSRTELDLPLPTMNRQSTSTPATGTWRRNINVNSTSPDVVSDTPQSPLLPSSTSPANPRNSTPSVEPLDLEGISFDHDPPATILKRLRDYLVSCGGRATSAAIIGHYRMKIKPEQVVLFRKMLKEIAEFEPDPLTKGTWVLRSTFQ